MKTKSRVLPIIIYKDILYVVKKWLCLNSSMLMTDDCSNVSSRANSECEYQYETEHNERQRSLSKLDPVHCIPFHSFLQDQVSNTFLISCNYLVQIAKYQWKLFTNPSLSNKNFFLMLDIVKGLVRVVDKGLNFLCHSNLY